ncbi:hypothetical protein M1D80_11805 [Phyllobacteriaceae bacterium JZ32]
MELIVGTVTSVFGGGAAASGAAAAGASGAAAATASTGLTLSSILQGTATVLGIVSSLRAGNAEGDALEAQAEDAKREQALETLQGIERRSSIRKALRDAQGAVDVAYASSGLDLSFGTAAKARSDAAREADLAIDTSTGTELTRQSRLMERAANYRSAAKRARQGGVINALTGGLKGAASIADRY